MHAKEGYRGNRAMVLVVAAITLVAAGFVASGCGSDDPEPRPNDAGYPFDEVRLAADGYPEIPKLTAAQKAEVVAIAKRDPRLREILGEHETKWGKVAMWTRGNQELLGGVIEIHFDQPVDLPDTTWVTIENTEDLYGKQGPEGVVLEEPEPRVEPEPGTYVSNEVNVRFLLVSVDLEQGQVVAISPMSF